MFKYSKFQFPPKVCGGELFDQIVDHNLRPYNGRFSEPEAKYVFLQIASGLDYVHQKKIVHRDLKPENILVSRRRALLDRASLLADRRWTKLMECDVDKASQLQAYDIKLSDFGLAKLVADGYSIATTRTGTPQYWAPEVASSVDKKLSNSGKKGDAKTAPTEG
jgi:serine/threonine-protein kinase CHEK2